jgi:hypothetical protein
MLYIPKLVRDSTVVRGYRCRLATQWPDWKGFGGLMSGMWLGLKNVKMQQEHLSFKGRTYLWHLMASCGHTEVCAAKMKGWQTPCASASSQNHGSGWVILTIECLRCHWRFMPEAISQHVCCRCEHHVQYLHGLNFGILFCHMVYRRVPHFK